MSEQQQPAIVLVEDAADVLELLREVALACTEGTNYEVISLIDGDSALDVVAQRTVPLVITDYMIYNRNGIALTAAVKACSPNTRVVLISGYATSQLEQQARAAGADMILRKPFAVEAIERLIRETLRTALPATHVSLSQTLHSALDETIHQALGSHPSVGASLQVAAVLQQLADQYRDRAMADIAGEQKDSDGPAAEG
jgi:DNA-binding NtrC family response regulator